MSETLEVERQILFGLLALQNQFIERPALIAAFRVWMTDRSRPLARVFEERGGIDQAALPLLDALVEHHLRLHGQDSLKSIAAIDPTGAVFGLASDPELARSLLDLSGSKNTDPEDPYATRGEAFIPPTVPPTDDVGHGAVKTSASGSFHSFPPGVSRFRVLRPHAKGGLGQVSVALDEELGRQVALKEIQDHHADHPEYRSRFIREAEITGKLEHPGIIPVYGLGRDLTGRPYYAMRFIRGDNLDDAIARYHRSLTAGASAGDQALQLRELLGRFLDVCNAIAYAHSRRVIHRDLKPGNILLGPFGETLVVDWGLAKPLDDDEDERPFEPGSTLGPVRPLLDGSGSTPTMAGVAHGTPAYMSPEQAEGRLDRLGPASDVYSLGATLYHILTGKAPFSGHDALRRVSLGDFPPPRQVIETIPQALEAICLKAMAVRADDRYPSPEALASDLKLWLADEPVTAWREPFSARAGRWMKRHRTTVTALSAGVLVSVVALGAIGVTLAGKNRELLLSERRADLARGQAERARAQAESALKQEQAAKAQADASAQAESLAKLDAEAARRRAEVEARTAGRTKDFLVDLFVDADPLALFTGSAGGSKSRGASTAVELLQRGAKKVVTELKSEPLVQASLMESIGNALRSKAELSKADPLLRQALALRKSQTPPDNLAIADSLENLGWLLQDQGKTAEAMEQYQEALTLRRSVLGENDLRVARVMFHIAWVYAEEGRQAEAETLFRKVLAIREAHPELPRDLAIARLGLGALMVDSGRGLEALPLILPALNAQLSEDGMEGGVESVSLFQLGVVLGQKKQYRLAENMLRNSLKISSQLLGADHPYNSFSIFTLAGLFDEQGKLDEAETFYRRCLAIVRNNPGMGYPRAAYLVFEFAAFLEKRGKQAEAMALYDEMVKERRARFAPDHVMLADGLTLQGTYLKRRDVKKSEALLREALAIFQKRPDYRSIRLLDAHEFLGEILIDRQAYREAAPHFRVAVELIPLLPRSNFVNQDDTKALDLSKLGVSTMHQGQFAEAEPALLESIRLYRTLPGPLNKTDISFPLDALSFLRRAQGRPGEAAALTDERRRACQGNANLLYKVASDLALCLPMVEPATLRQTWGDQAIDVLRQAIRTGFADVRRLRTDPTFQSLHNRRDFRDLAADLGFPANPFRTSK